MNLGGKKVGLDGLLREIVAAGIAAEGLVVQDDDVRMYDERGAIVDLPAEAAAVIAAHVKPAPKTTVWELAATAFEKAGTLAEVKTALVALMRAQK